VGVGYPHYLVKSIGIAGILRTHHVIEQFRNSLAMLLRSPVSLAFSNFAKQFLKQ